MPSSWYRSAFFMYKGNREYTRQGYEAAQAHFDPNDMDVDCSDKHYMITGCNSGIGLETAREIAKKGGIIHMVCRNLERAKAAKSEIIETTGNDKIHIYKLDLSKPCEVANWSNEWLETHDKLDVLIHNAGCMIHERTIDDDGIDANFATNTLAVHILTRTFVHTLQRSNDARVILVSSAGMLTEKLNPYDLPFEKMIPYDGRSAYSQNKRQQVVMTLAYAQSFDRIHFSSMHPGWADTVAVRTSIPAFFEAMKDVLRTAAQGADTVAWLAVSPSAIKHPSGFFFQDRAPCPTHLPLAWTRSSSKDEDLLMTKLDELFAKAAGYKLQPPAMTSGRFYVDDNDTNVQNNPTYYSPLKSNLSNDLAPMEEIPTTVNNAGNGHVVSNNDTKPMNESVQTQRQLEEQTPLSSNDENKTVEDACNVFGEPQKIIDEKHVVDNIHNNNVSSKYENNMEKQQETKQNVEKKTLEENMKNIDISSNNDNPVDEQHLGKEVDETVQIQKVSMDSKEIVEVHQLSRDAEEIVEVTKVNKDAEEIAQVQNMSKDTEEIVEVPKISKDADKTVEVHNMSTDAMESVELQKASKDTEEIVESHKLDQAEKETDELGQIKAS